jgi:hypothetical protein
MHTKTINDWIIYHEIGSLLQENLSLEEVSKAININLKKVKKYVAMNDTDLIKVGQLYFSLNELPYGYQAQVDFTSFIMHDERNKEKIVYFFAMMLSRSQMMFIRYSDVPFTVQAAIEAHEQAFEFFKGIPKEIVYNHSVSDSTGQKIQELLMTAGFKTYVFEQELIINFLIKSTFRRGWATRNVIDHVKDNFISGRVYCDIETLQNQSKDWLSHTDGGMPHTGKNITPLQDWAIEQPYLKSWCTVKILPSYILRTVHKNNTFFYNGKCYPVPNGTYRKKRSYVRIYLKEDALHVFDYMQDKFLSKYPIIWK